MAYIPSRRKRHHTDRSDATINLTSMMDMFTIILVFLLKTYATEGALIQPSESLALPHSSVRNQPEVALDLIVSKEMILVNDKPVVSMAEVAKQRGGIIELLKKELMLHSSKALEMEEKHDIVFSGKVVIQGDKSIHYKDLVKVMATCGASDFPNMRLVVYQSE